MLKIRPLNKFKKDLKLAQKRGNDIETLKTIITKLSQGESLNLKYRDHSLKSNYIDCRECHVQPDFLLVYRLTEHELQLIRLGTHSDLFR